MLKWGRDRAGDIMDMQKFWDSYYESEFNTQVKADPRFVSVMEKLDLKPAIAVDLGAGEGGDAFWLAEHGWKVIAVDFSAYGVTKLEEEALTRRIPIRVAQANILEFKPAKAPSLVHLGYIHLETVQRSVLFDRIKSMLKPDGILSYIGMTGMDEGDLPPGVSPDIFAELEILLPLVSDMDVIAAEQGLCEVDMGNGPEDITGVTLVVRKK
jgi:cyclopropane fatty-acyl-phospholipid synthase-like methyltransferase